MLFRSGPPQTAPLRPGGVPFGAPRPLQPPMQNPPPRQVAPSFGFGGYGQQHLGVVGQGTYQQAPAPNFASPPFGAAPGVVSVQNAPGVARGARQLREM